MNRKPTPYQLEVLELAAAGDPDKGDDRGIDFDQLLDRLSWTPTKAAAQFTIRALVGRGLIEKNELVIRRGRRRVCFVLTEKGEAELGRPASVPAVPTGRPSVVPEPSEALEETDPGVPFEVVED